MSDERINDYDCHSELELRVDRAEANSARLRLERDALREQVAQLVTANRQLNDNLTSTQRRCTELLMAERVAIRADAMCRALDAGLADFTDARYKALVDSLADWQKSRT